jgi:UDP-3-O-[3-hydroxymyristoyl] glucosamine N-acyltransferase
VAGKALSVRELGELLGASPLPGSDRPIRGAAPLAQATPEDVSFLESPAYAAQAAASRAGAILTREPLDAPASVLLFVAHPRAAFARCLQLFHARPRPAEGRHPSAVVDPSARLGPGCAIGPLCVVGAGAEIGAGSILEAGVIVGTGARLGEGCRLHPGAVLLDGVRLGDRVVVQSRSVIGSEGFGYTTLEGRHTHVPHVGTVLVEDDVEIGAGCCIDRATVGATEVGAGTKIDNLVHIAHNVRIGPGCLIVAQVGISGSVTVGAGATLAGKVGVAGHLEIGAGAVVAAASRVVRSVPAGATVAGWPAVEVGLWRRTSALLRRLPRMWERLQRLEQAVGREVQEPSLHEDPSDCDR